MILCVFLRLKKNKTLEIVGRRIHLLLILMNFLKKIFISERYKTPNQCKCALEENAHRRNSLNFLNFLFFLSSIYLGLQYALKLCPQSSMSECCRLFFQVEEVFSFMQPVWKYKQMPYLLGIGWEGWKLSKIFLARPDSMCMERSFMFSCPDQ